jgi:hypothetical protein
MREGHEAVDYAKRLWQHAGLLSQSVTFRAFVDVGVPSRLVLIVDAGQVGRKSSMTVRCVRQIEMARVSTQLETVIDELYRAIQESMAASAGIGVRF